MQTHLGHTKQCTPNRGNDLFSRGDWFVEPGAPIGVRVRVTNTGKLATPPALNLRVQALDGCEGPDVILPVPRLEPSASTTFEVESMACAAPRPTLPPSKPLSGEVRLGVGGFVNGSAFGGPTTLQAALRWPVELGEGYCPAATLSPPPFHPSPPSTTTAAAAPWQQRRPRTLRAEAEAATARCGRCS